MLGRPALKQLSACAPGPYPIRELIRTKAPDPGIWSVGMSSSSTTQRPYPLCKVDSWSLIHDAQQVSQYLTAKCQQLTLQYHPCSPDTWGLDDVLKSEDNCNSM